MSRRTWSDCERSDSRRRKHGKRTALRRARFDWGRKCAACGSRKGCRSRSLRSEWACHATVDVDDPDEVVDLVIDRMLALQIDVGLSVHLIPIRTPERTAS